MLPLLLFSLLPSTALAVPAASADKTFADCAADVPVRLTSSPDFAQLIKPFNLRVPFTPAVVALPESYKHVQTLVKCGAKYKYHVSARSGGHSYNAEGLGGENGHVVVDLENLHSVNYDKKTTNAVVQGGARLGNIAQGIYDADKRAIPHGTCPPVGVGGHSLHGGFGISGRMWGLMSDNIVSVKVVTADGQLRTASKTENSDLFWALRGAGPSFGIVVEFTFKTYAATENNVNYSYDWTGVKDPKKMASIASTIQTYVKDAPKELGIGLSLFGGNGSSIEFSGVYYGKSMDDYNKYMNPLLAKLPTPNKKDVHNAGWIDTLIRYAGTKTLTLPPTGYDGHDTFFAKSLVNDMDHPFTTSQWESYIQYANSKGQEQTDKNNHWFVIANLYGGGNSAINNKALLDEASYPHRNSEWVFQFYGTISGTVNTASNNEVESFIGGFVKSISSGREKANDAAYANYQDPTLGRAQAQQLYYGPSLTKLEQAKAKWDKGNVFYYPQSIDVAGGNAKASSDDPSSSLPPSEVPTGTAAPANANGGNSTSPTATSLSSAPASAVPSSGTNTPSAASSVNAVFNGLVGLLGCATAAVVVFLI